MEKYYSYVEGVKDDQNDLITEESAKHVSIIIGPVDVDVYCDNELVGRVTKNAVDATANSIDIRVEGDTKIILYPDDSRYEIRISALDEGRMTFGQIDLIGRGVTKVIKDVSLTRGKLFSGTVGGGRTADEFRLYETNKSWKTLSEALSVSWVGGKSIDLVSFYKLMSFVPRLYRHFLEREPDETGLGNWVDALYSGRATGAKLVCGFVLSKEYQANSLSDEEYVTAMYRIIFKREPDAAGLKSWITVLDNGCTNKKILEGFINSEEFRNLCKELGITPGSYKSDEICDNNYPVSSFVARLYRLCLNRRYERGGQDNWIRALVYKNATGTSVALNFFNSQEFLNRNLNDEEFVYVAYKTILDREPDEPGKEYWLEKLREGYTRNQVLEGFLKSTEFDELCKTYGIESYDHKTEKPDTKISYNVQYIRTNGYVSGEKYPKIFWITSADELKSYFEANKDKYNLGRRVDPYSGAMGFTGVAEQYDTVFFEENDLIVIVMEEGSGSIRHEVSNLHIEASQEDGMKYVIQPEIIRILPEIGTCDMAEWHIIIEISKDYGKTVAQLKMPIIIDVPNRRT
jgi:hypothetical protein